MESNPIFIVGMPASGKSTFGRALARRLGRRFVDLDAYIENRFHTTVRALFADRGERAFRRLEALMLREVGEFEDVVVATGATSHFGPSMNCCIGRVKPWCGNSYSIARTIGSPDRDVRRAWSRMYGANSSCSSAKRRQCATFSGDR